MCIPELILFDDDSHNRHSRRRGNAIRPLTIDSDTPQPLLSSPPFVVHVSPKVGHHHRASIRHQPTRRSTAPLPSREREGVDWREGFRAGREAAQKREVEDGKRNATESKKETVTESKAKARVPEIVITAATPTRGTESKSTPTTPNPATVEDDVDGQPPLQRTVSAPQPTPAPAPAPAPIQPPPQDQQPRQTRPQHHQQRQQQQYRQGTQPSIPAYRPSYQPLHQYYYRPPTPPSDNSTTSTSPRRTPRGLRRSLSNIWTHIATLERWAMADADARDRHARQVRVRRELDDEVRRARRAEEERQRHARRARDGDGGVRRRGEVRFEGERSSAPLRRRRTRTWLVDGEDDDGRGYGLGLGDEGRWRRGGDGVVVGDVRNGWAAGSGRRWV